MVHWPQRHPTPPPIRLLIIFPLRLQVPWVWRGRVALQKAFAAAAMLALVSLLPSASAIGPLFYEAESMTSLRLPADTEPRELIYRLRASDADRNYPLRFSANGADSSLMDIESKYEFGYVYLRQSLNKLKNYTFILEVSDQLGNTVEELSRIYPTAGRTPISNIFLKYSASAVVPEDAEFGAEVTYVVVRRKARESVDFVILGPSAKLFKVRAKLYSTDTFRGDVLLQGQLDYETVNLHVLKVCALNPYTNIEVDTRNIVCVTVSVLVEDRQDQPPIFTRAPPVTNITGETLKGDELVRIVAEDGDRGIAREIRYSMQAASTLYARFFGIDAKTGSISLDDTVSSLVETMTSLEPILVTVTAVELNGEESRDPPEEYTSSVEIAFVVMDADMMNPQFIFLQYVGEVKENSPPDTIVTFPRKRFLKEGVRGSFALSIEGGNRIFAVTPSVIRDSQEFAIVVKESELLDYEAITMVEFKLKVKQVSGTATAQSTTDVRINIIDINDNYPVFLEDPYEAKIYENIAPGTQVTRIQATDLDKGDFGSIRYMRLTGKLADKLFLDRVSGLISCDSNCQGFDREKNPELQLTAVACDNNGIGNCAFTRILITILDVNDETPYFEKRIYKGQMTPDQTGLKSELMVQATDIDAEEPNNQILYSLDAGIYKQNFRIDRFTGEITVREALSINPIVENFNGRTTERDYGYKEEFVINMRVTATDQGKPPLSASVPVQIYTQDYVERQITFILARPPNEVNDSQMEIEGMLDTLIGGSTQIVGVERHIRSGLERYTGTNDTRSSNITKELSEIETRVRYKYKTLVNVDDVYRRLRTTEPVTGEQQSPVEISVLTGQRNSYLIVVVILCIFLAIIIIIVIVCWLCPGCPLYARRKKRKAVEDENAENVPDFRVDEHGNYHEAYEKEKIWWDYLPTCCTDLFTACGISRPKSKSGRLAWSGDEREKHWQFGGGGEGASLDDRAMVRQGPRDQIVVEDLDDDRLQQQPRIARVDSRTSHFSQEGRRRFVMRDQRGIPRIMESMREGEHYIMEDIGHTPRNLHRRGSLGPQDRQEQAIIWSDDERQRYLQFGRGREGDPLDIRALVRRGPRDQIPLDYLDEARLQQQARIVRVDSRTSHRSQEGHRRLMVRDQQGNLRIAEPLREGEHYIIMEDKDDTPRTLPRRRSLGQQNYQEALITWSDDERQGNGQFGRGRQGAALDDGALVWRRSPRDQIPLDVLEEARLRQQAHMVREDSSTSPRLQEGHRRLMVKDREGNLRMVEPLGEGEQYVIMDNKDDTPRTLHRRGSLDPLDLQDTSVQATTSREYGGDSSSEDNSERRRKKNPPRLRHKERHKNKRQGLDFKEGGKSERDQENEVRESGEGSESQTRIVTEVHQGNSLQRPRLPNVEGSSTNLLDDLKDQKGDEELLKIMDNENNFGMDQGSQLFENEAELESVIKAGRRRRRRNPLLEKKSIFTIAYDDMQTDQLRPDSAIAEP